MEQTTPKPVFTFSDLSSNFPPRVEVLQTAIKLTAGDRNNTYGDPTKNMDAFAALVRAYLHYSLPNGDVNEIGAHDAAILMALTKIARIAVGSKPHKDNYIDGAAYLGMAWETTQHDSGN